MSNTLANRFIGVDPTEEPLRKYYLIRDSVVVKECSNEYFYFDGNTLYTTDYININEAAFGSKDISPFLQNIVDTSSIKIAGHSINLMEHEIDGEPFHDYYNYNDDDELYEEENPFTEEDIALYNSYENHDSMLKYKDELLIDCTDGKRYRHNIKEGEDLLALIYSTINYKFGDSMEILDITVVTADSKQDEAPFRKE